MKMKEEPIVPVRKISESELRNEVEKLKLQVIEASKKSAERPVTGLKEMVEKLKREIEFEYDVAAKALGMWDKILMMREKVAKGRNLTNQLANSAMKEKIEHLNDEFRKNLPTAPNYPSLISKLKMLEELSKASDLTKKGTDNRDELKLEIKKKFSEIMDRPDVKRKIEMLKGEIGNSDIDLEPQLKEKVLQLREELESEFKTLFESEGWQVVSKIPKALTKIDAFGEEVTMIIDDVVNSSDLKGKIELLRTMVGKAGNAPDEESESKIQALEAEIKKGIAEAISIPELKEKHERLAAEILEDNESSVGSNGSLNVEANRSFV